MEQIVMPIFIEIEKKKEELQFHKNRVKYK